MGWLKRSVTAVLAGLSMTGAAQATELFIVYTGEDDYASIEVDGYGYRFGDEGVAVVPSIYSGSHSIVLYAGGESLSATIDLQDRDLVPEDEYGPATWCLEVGDEGYLVTDAYDCEEILYLGF